VHVDDGHLFKEPLELRIGGSSLVSFCPCDKCA
jgi:hypothetical protein